MIATPKVIVNNGFGQFHLARLAENLYESGMLRSFLTGAYPKGWAPRLLTQLDGFAPIKRLTEREIQVPADLVRSCWLAELPHQIAQQARTGGQAIIAEFTTGLSMDLYSAWSKESLRSMSANVYHYRAGMGGESVELAKELGMAAVCDHSIAHPRLLQGLVDGTGGYSSGLDALWSRVEADIQRADRLLVNSDFVAQTCVDAGIPADKVSVAYTAVDPMFIEAIKNHSSPRNWSEPNVLFAGTLEKRKGVDVVIEACRSLLDTNISCLVLGDWLPDAVEYERRLPSNIELKAKVPRAELGRLMAEASIFLFPTRAEGSARVVAEALAAGCYVVTTSNAGSVVRDGIDGRLVPVGDPKAVDSAIREYLGMPVTERASRSRETSEYARVRLSEGLYADSVNDAYRRVSDGV